MEPDERAIRELHEIWIEAVNAGDLDRLLSLITPDVILLQPGQPPGGDEEFSASFLDAHRRLRLACHSELEEVVVVGDLAYTRCRDALSVTSRADGETTQLAGHRLTVYRKQADGRWLLARDAHTLTPVGE